MDIEVIKEYSDLRKRIEQIKEKISNEFCNYVGIKFDFEGKSLEENALDYEHLSLEKDRLERRIDELNKRNLTDLSFIRELEESIYVTIDSDDGRRLDEFYLTDELSLEKKKLSDQLREKIINRDKEVSILSKESGNIGRKSLVALYSKYPFGVTLNNNYLAIDKLEKTIQLPGLSDNNQDLSKRLSEYNKALNKVKGTETQFIEVVDLIIKDAKEIGAENLVEETAKVLEIKPNSRTKGHYCVVKVNLNI